MTKIVSGGSRSQIAVRRVGGAVKLSFHSGVPALQASIPFLARNHALTRVATNFRRFAPGLPAQPIEAHGTQSFRDQPRRGGSE